MAKISDLINGLLGNRSNSVSNQSTNTNSNVQNNFDNLSATAKNLLLQNTQEVKKFIDEMKKNETRNKQLYQDIDIAVSRWEQAQKRHGDDSWITKQAKLNLQRLEEEYNKSFKDYEEHLKRFGQQNNLTRAEIEELANTVSRFGESISDSNNKIKNNFKNTSDIINRTFNNISGDINNFFEDFGVWGAVIAAATNRMIDLNTKLVEHNRSMGGQFSNDMLGMDLYGSSASGNLDTITSGNNINTVDFLKSQEIFKNRTIGLTDNLDNQAATMREYGIEVGKLSKFYGVEMATINQISGKFLFDYGVKVKDLGGILQEGKEAAAAAGVSIQSYFAKLKDATDSLGEYYIAGGIKGMENLALYAAKTDSSVRSILGYSEKFKDFTSQWDQQNKASQLGLQAASIQMTKIWALSQMGRQAEASALMSSTLVSDLRNNGSFDKDNKINQKGLLSLEALGIDKEQIGQIERLNRVWKETGITAEQQLNIDKQSIDVRRKLAQYEAQNATVSERLNSLWTKAKALILDPLQSILAPILDTGLNVLVTVIDILSFVMKPVIYGFKVIGDVLTSVGKVISDGASWVSSTLEDLGIKFDKGSGVLTQFARVAGTVIAGMITLSLGMKAVGIARGIGSTLGLGGGGILRGARGLISSGSGAVGGILKSGAGRAGVAGLIGYGLGQAVGGEGGDAISNIASGAGTGAMIGSVIPVVGTLVGGIIGGLGGLIYSSWDKIDSIWSDNSKNIFEKIGGSALALTSTISEAISALWDKIKEWSTSLWDWASGNSIKDAVKEGTKEANDNSKYAGNMAVRNMYTNPSPQIAGIMNQRIIENAFESSKTQEKLIEKQTPTNVKVSVSTSLYGNAPKQRINQF